MADDEDDEPPDGFGEPGDRRAQIKLMDDATLLSTYRALSNPRAIAQDSEWISFIESEIRARGLMPLN